MPQDVQDIHLYAVYLIRFNKMEQNGGVMPVTPEEVEPGGRAWS